MAAGESPPENGTQTTEDDSDWSDFTSESTRIDSGLCFGEQPESKSLPSRDSRIFSTICETTRVCFQHETVSDDWDAFSANADQNRHENKTNRKIDLLGEISCSMCRQSNTFVFPHPTWKGSTTQSCQLKSLGVTDLHKRKEQEAAASPVDRLHGFFNFHRLSEKNIELWRSSRPSQPSRPSRPSRTCSWDPTDLQSDTASASKQPKDRTENVPSTFSSNVNRSESELCEIMNELDVWSDSENGEAEEMFMLFGQRINGRPTSFDECQAAAGLRHLSHKELLDLRDEMSAYVNEYSEVLVEELIVKDEQIREKEIKNVFISSLLTLQSKLREVQSNQGRKKNGPSVNKYLTTVIPYEEQVGGLKTADLEKIIEIMDAMAEDSPTVPNLLTEYILKVLCP